MVEIIKKERIYKNFLIMEEWDLLAQISLSSYLENTDANVFNIDNMSVGSNVQNLSDFIKEEKIYIL